MKEKISKAIDIDLMKKVNFDERYVFMDIERQDLRFEGKSLSKIHAKISDYGIKAGSTVILNDLGAQIPVVFA